MSNIIFHDKSSVLISGKIYVCEECGKEVRIEFQGGAKAALVGKDFISRQLALTTKQKPPTGHQQPNKNPWKDGFYLFGFALCRECFEKDDLKKEFDPEVVEEVIADLRESRKVLLEDVGGLAMKKFKYLVEGLTRKNIHSFLGKPSEADVGDRHVNPNKKKRLLKAFVRKKIDTIERKFFKKIWEQVKELEAILNYKEKKKNALRELKDTPVQYTPQSTTEEVFLGPALPFPFICGRRVPEEGSIAEDFYYRERISINSCAEKIMFNIDSLGEAIPEKDRKESDLFKN
ncbi:hypothetical protein KAI46_11690 [bacterium]|nr:hypothetical protein [bacterium]